MKSILVILSIFLVTHSSCAQKLTKNMFSFESQEAIKKWGENEFGTPPESQFIEIGEHKVYVLFCEYTSGVSRKTIYVYLQTNSTDKEEWRLLLFRDTNTSKVTIEIDPENDILFKSKSGKKLLELPFNALNLNYDSLER